MHRILRRNRPGLVALAAMVALMIVVAPVAARSPQKVTIVSHVTFNPDGPNYGTFTATGAAVDGGLICPAGTFIDTGIRFAGFQSPRGVVQLQVLKDFTCDGGNGTFSIKMQIQADFTTGIESFSWIAWGGVRGTGLGSTVPEPPTGNVNTFVGFILG